MNGPSIQSGIAGGVGRYLSPEVTPWSGGGMDPITIGALLGLGSKALEGIFGWKRSGQQVGLGREALAEQRRQADERQKLALLYRQDKLDADERDRELVAEWELARRQRDLGRHTSWSESSRPYREISRDIAAKRLGKAAAPVRDYYALPLPEPIDSQT